MLFQGSGLTIEQKMPRLAAQTSEMDADLSEAAHEGSASPNARKRKKVRRRSIETNNVGKYGQMQALPWQLVRRRRRP